MLAGKCTRAATKQHGPHKMFHHHSTEEVQAPGAAPRPAAPKEAAPVPSATGSTPRVLVNFLTEDEAAAELHQAIRTLRKWRTAGSGPSYVKVGREILYPRDNLIAWVSSKIIDPVRERKPVRRRAAT
jgi:Helix-turn-helix domain